MLSPRPKSFLFLRAILVGGFLATAAALVGANGGFSTTLSDSQRDSSGLSALTDEQRASLDLLIASDVSRARRDSADEPNGTFVSRLTDVQLKQAGLDRLTPDQLAKLNDQVAMSIGSGPKPKIRPRLKDDDVILVRKPEIHGTASLTLGWSKGGGNFRDASLWVDYFDPDTGLGISVGLDSFKGSGLYGFFPGYGSRYGFGAASLNDPFYFGGLRDGFYDQGSLRGSAAWDEASGHGYRHR